MRDYWQFDTLFYGVARFSLTPIPWNVEPVYEYLVIPTSLHWLSFIPALVARGYLWGESKYARLFFIYLACLVGLYAITEDLLGPRQRFQVAFLFAWAQFHFAWKMKPAGIVAATRSPRARQWVVPGLRRQAANWPLAKGVRHDSALGEWNPSDRLKITHVIGSLGVGRGTGPLWTDGRASPTLAKMKVVSLISGGVLTDSLLSRGIEVETLAMNPARPDPSVVVRLARRLRDDRPDLVVTWMYHANLIGGLAAKLADRIPVVWNVRHTRLEPGRSKRLTRWIARVGGVLSRSVPDAIVYVARAARESLRAGICLSRIAGYSQWFPTC